jgi:hypothetical protein
MSDDPQALPEVCPLCHQDDVGFEDAMLLANMAGLIVPGIEEGEFRIGVARSLERRPGGPSVSYLVRIRWRIEATLDHVTATDE